MDGLILGLLYSAAVAVLTAVHEAGHYLAGRMAGVPARALRIRLLTFPPHVALRDGEEWVEPASYARYVAVAGRYLSSSGKAFAYVAGGSVVETAGVTLLCAGAVALGWPGGGFVVASAALGLHTLYLLLFDLVLTWRTGTPGGDHAALWTISRGGGLAVVVGVLAVKGGLVWWTYGLLGTP